MPTGNNPLRRVRDLTPVRPSAGDAESCGYYLYHPLGITQTTPYFYAISILHYVEATAHIIHLDAKSSRHNILLKHGTLRL